MIKIAVIGVGSMGRNHVRVLKDIPEVDCVGIADTNLGIAKKIADKYKLSAYDDYHRLLSEKKPQAIVIAVPTVFHREVALTAIKQGIHVLIEKPIASSIEEAHDLINAANAHHVKIAVGHIERFNPAVTELKRRIDIGELGKVFMIHSRRLSPFPGRIQDVGVAKDLATHELDMMRFLTGSEVDYLSAEVSQVMNTGHEDIVFGLLRFQNGVLGILDVNWVTPTTVRELSITGEQGMFVVNYLSQDLYFHENPAARVPLNGSVWDFTVDAGHMTRFQIIRKEPLRSELESFVDAINNNERPLIDGQDGLEALQLAIRITEQRQLKQG